MVEGRTGSALRGLEILKKLIQSYFECNFDAFCHQNDRLEISLKEF
jgi:hypothetical protein